jgi:FkbM family methyltransferase
MRYTGENSVQLISIRGDSKAYADLGEGVIRLIVISGGFEEHLLSLGDAFLADGGVCLDVGANHGLFSFGLAGRHGAAVEFRLFEPNPKMLKVIELSRQLYPNMKAKINATAVSDYDGYVCFMVIPDHTGMSHVVTGEGMQVEALTLDTYLATTGIDHVEFMKIDVEGHELSVLRGASAGLRKRCFAAIYFEYCEKWLSRSHVPEDLITHLGSFDYEVCFCRAWDVQDGQPPQTVRAGGPGHGVPLWPIANRPLPSTTDLLAVPRENLVPLDLPVR